MRSPQRQLLGGFLALMLGCGDGSDSFTPPDPPPPPPPPPAPLYDRIIFSRFDPANCVTGPCRPALWTARPDGSDLRLLVGNLNWPESPVVSPDGRTVAFENWGRLYLVNSEGKEGRELVTGLGEDNYSPRWSPDGQWIMFRGPDHPTATTQLYRIRPDGTGLSRITDRFKGHAFGGDWSPDGSKIVFSRQEFGTCCAYWAVVQDLATGVETVVVDSSTGFDGRQASWSPDGKTVLFLGSHLNQWAILRVDLSTGAFGFFADARGNRPAIWSPDGSTILFGTGDLWLMDADGGNQRAILADGMTNLEAFWTPAAPAP